MWSWMQKVLILLFILFSLKIGWGKQLANPDSIIWNRVLEADGYRKAGDYQRSIDILTQLLRNYEGSAAVADTSLAWVYHKLGWTFYWTDDYQKALDYTTKAIEIRENRLGALHPDLANSKFNRGAIHWFVGSLDEAEADLLGAIRIIEETTLQPPPVTDSILAHYYTTIGAIAEEKGDYFRAFPFWDQALKYYKKQQRGNLDQIAYLHDRQGVAFQDLGAYQDAFKAFQKALDLYAASPKADAEDLAVTCHGIGLTLAKSGDFPKAIEYLERSVDYFVSSGIIISLPKVYADLVWGYTQLEQFEAAERAFSSGMNYVKQIHPVLKGPEAGELWWRKAELELAQGNIDEALDYHQFSIGAFLPDYFPDQSNVFPTISESSAIIGPRELLLDALASWGETYYQQFKITEDNSALEAALQCYLAGDTLITSIRQSQFAAESKYVLNRKVITLYERSIELALTLYSRTNAEAYLTLAYRLAAQNKSIILLEGLKDQNARQFSGLPDSLLQAEMNLKSQSYQLERELANQLLEGKDSLAQASKDQLFKLRRRYENLVRRLEAEFPNYYELKYGPLTNTDVGQLQHQLDDHSCLVEYFVGTRAIYTFLITAEGMQYYVTPKPANFEAVCQTYRQKLASHTLTADEQEALYQSAYQLYQWLLNEPLSDLPTGIDRLVIIPDDVLLYISFDALVYDLPQSSVEAEAMPFLLNRYAISYAYSNRLAFNRVKSKKIADRRKRFAGFGLEYDSYTLEGLNALDTLGKNRALALAERSMGKLIHSDDEVREIAQLVEGQTWLNQEATKRNFLRYAGDYQLLHLAMHSIVDENRPLNSALVFNREKGSEDYLLYASEVYDLELPNAEMVVLSACNTGFGQLRRGEGIRNLSRAFAYAGSPSLVVSLWSTPDRSTKEIMVAFYEYLQEGLPKDEAIRRAKIDYIKNTNPQYANPYFWSHLIVTGDPSSFVIRKSNTARTILIVCAGVLLLILGLWVISKTR